MLKQVLHFGNPAKLGLKDNQLVIARPEKENLTRPLEDIACIVIDHAEVTCTTPLLVKAAEEGLVVIWCNEKHLPVAYSTPHPGHRLSNLRHRHQWEAGMPVFKQAWAQIVRAKLTHQAAVLEYQGKEAALLHRLAKEVKSGDPENTEAQGARYYWTQFLPGGEKLLRDPEGPFPNNLLNYGYAIIRAGMARALAGAGLCVTIGIFHHNQYNPYALADDCMEPFRPWVDLQVVRMVKRGVPEELNKDMKAELLSVLHQDVFWPDRSQSPMMVAMDEMAASLAQFFAGESKSLKIPQLRSV